MTDDIKKLELRITELENKLKAAQAQGGQRQANIDPEDMKVYEKVSQQLGIQPAVCQQCIVYCQVCYPCYRCINECICGPCSFCYINQGGFGGGRFGGLG